MPKKPLDAVQCPCFISDWETEGMGEVNYWLLRSFFKYTITAVGKTLWDYEIP